MLEKQLFSLGEKLVGINCGKIFMAIAKTCYIW